MKNQIKHIMSLASLNMEQNGLILCKNKPIENNKKNQTALKSKSSIKINF